MNVYSLRLRFHRLLLLPHFYILVDTFKSAGGGSGGGGSIADESIAATVYSGGAAVIGGNMTTALVELLSDEEDCEYRLHRYVSAREISPNDTPLSPNPTNPTHTAQQPDRGFEQETNGWFALVTPLSTASYAARTYVTYASSVVLPRLHTVSRRLKIFLGTGVVYLWLEPMEIGCGFPTDGNKGMRTRITTLLKTRTCT